METTTKKFDNIEEQRSWNREDWWTEAGHEWSGSFGTTENLWNKEIFDSVKEFRGTKALEIAPGHGRITQFLAILVDELSVVDLNEYCIVKTREKLGSHIKDYIVNNGNDLPGIEDNSLDLVFSYDSFVHMHKNVTDDYLAEIARVLKPGGKGWIHHSWLYGANEYSFKNWGGRAEMDPEEFKKLVEKHGMKICTQNEIKFDGEGGWGGKDCISIFEKPIINEEA